MLKYLIALLLAVNTVQVQAQVSQPQPQIPPKLADKETYEKTLKHYISWKDNLSNPVFYKKFVWEGEDVKKKFSDLTDFEKDQFYLIQGFKLTKELQVLRILWDNEIMCLKSGKYTIPIAPAPPQVDAPPAVAPDPVPPIAPPDPPAPAPPATAEEVEEFQKQLLNLQKENAVAFEKLMDTVFKRHKDLIPKKERDFIKKQIILFHDSLELVERKKDEP